MDKHHCATRMVPVTADEASHDRLDYEVLALRFRRAVIERAVEKRPDAPSERSRVASHASGRAGTGGAGPATPKKESPWVVKQMGFAPGGVVIVLVTTPQHRALPRASVEGCVSRGSSAGR